LIRHTFDKHTLSKINLLSSTNSDKSGLSMAQ